MRMQMHVSVATGGRAAEAGQQQPQLKAHSDCTAKQNHCMQDSVGVCNAWPLAFRVHSFMFADASTCMMSMQAQLAQVTSSCARAGTHLLIKALEDLFRSDEKLHVGPCRTTDPFCTTMTMNNRLSVVSPSRAVAQIHCLLISVLCRGSCDGVKARATHECRWYMPFESRHQQASFIHRGDLWARRNLM